MKTTEQPTASSAILHRQLKHDMPAVQRGEGSYLILEGTGQRVFDACGGAAVAGIGHGDKRVMDAVVKQMTDLAYCASMFYTSDACEKLGRFLVESTDGHMARAYIVCSGSEAVEAAIKMARQYFLDKPEPEPARIRFIARHQSYHGTTLGGLALGGHRLRRQPYEPLLSTNTSRVSPCYAYRGKEPGESDEAYVARLAAELDAEFQRVGPETVCAFVAETAVGAALGCVPAVAGYFKAIEAVCRKYGALFIMDEVMCGMGRTGTLHAWQQEDVKPDLQTIGKVLGGGYQPIAGVLVSKSVIDALSRGPGFNHGHTYQGHPVACAAALAVQNIIVEDNLLANVRELGPVLMELLEKRLGNHPNVGDIHGRGFFLGIEFVADKATKRPFPPALHIAMEVSQAGLAPAYSIAVYPGSGSVDGLSGDGIMIAPAYNVTRADVDIIVDSVGRLIEDFFAVPRDGTATET